MMYRPGVYKTSLTRSNGESRDLKSMCDNLEKELERKEARNENLSKELTALRASYANQQRENRIVTGTFEKLNSERISLLNESGKSREQINKLESQLSRLGDSQLLLDHLGKQQDHIDTLQGRLTEAQGACILKDEIIKSHAKELDTLHRAFDIQDRYEASSSGHRGNSVNAIQVEREKMRSLYYELGKRQTDAHSLTLTLADSSVEIDRLKQCLKEGQASNVQMEATQMVTQNKCEELLKEKEVLSKSLSEYEERISIGKDLNNKLKHQIEDLSKRLSETRTAGEVAVNEKEVLVFELSSLLYASQMEAVNLNSKIEELNDALSHMQSFGELSEQRITTNLNKAISERKMLTELLEEAESLRPQMTVLRQHLDQSIEDKNTLFERSKVAQRTSDDNVRQARSIAEELQKELGVTQQQLDSVQRREGEAQEERMHALNALQRTLEAAKSLTVKLQAEKDKRIAAEKMASKAERLSESLQRAKEHVSSAVLDALQQEKAKSARLEKVLQGMASSRDINYNGDYNGGFSPNPSSNSLQSVQSVLPIPDSLPPPAPLMPRKPPLATAAATVASNGHENSRAQQLADTIRNSASNGSSVRESKLPRPRSLAQNDESPSQPYSSFPSSSHPQPPSAYPSSSFRQSTSTSTSTTPSRTPPSPPSTPPRSRNGSDDANEGGGDNKVVYSTAGNSATVNNSSSSSGSSRNMHSTNMDISSSAIPSFSHSSPSRIMQAPVHTEVHTNQSKDINIASDQEMKRNCNFSSGINQFKINSYHNEHDIKKDIRHMHNNNGLDSHDSRADKITTERDRGREEEYLSNGPDSPSSSSSHSIVKGLTRLRDHLREIEESVPSPMEQSKSHIHYSYSNCISQDEGDDGGEGGEDGGEGVGKDGGEGDREGVVESYLDNVDGNVRKNFTTHEMHRSIGRDEDIDRSQQQININGHQAFSGQNKSNLYSQEDEEEEEEGIEAEQREGEEEGDNFEMSDEEISLFDLAK